jgi:hypothetical protein
LAVFQLNLRCQSIPFERKADPAHSSLGSGCGKLQLNLDRGANFLCRISDADPAAAPANFEKGLVRVFARLTLTMSDSDQLLLTTFRAALNSADLPGPQAPACFNHNDELIERYRGPISLEIMTN